MDDLSDKLRKPPIIQQYTCNGTNAQLFTFVPAK